MSNMSSQRERIEAHRRGQQSRSGIVWTLVIIAVVVIVGYLVWIGIRPAEGTQVAIEGESHIPDGTDPGYVSNPPTSGPHYETPLPGGFYEEADLEAWSPFPEGHAVHNLEHGYIVFWYNCDVLDESSCEELKTQIRDFMNSPLTTKKLVAFPWHKTDVPLVLTSWGYMLEMSVFNAGRANAFIAANAPKAPEPNAQ